MSPMLEHSQMVAQQDRMDQLRAAFHANCIACGKWGGETSRLHFTVAAPNTVHASFQPSAAYESYGGVLHGGVIATLETGYTRPVAGKGPKKPTTTSAVKRAPGAPGALAPGKPAPAPKPQPVQPQ